MKLRVCLFLSVCLVLPGTASAQSWIQLSPTGVPPAARDGQTGVYDSTNNRLIVFGGGPHATCGNPLNDTWVLSNANGLGGTPAWTPLSPTGALPAARFEASAVYDQATNRMIVFGGFAANLCFFSLSSQNDVWVLSNANGLGGTPAWTQLSPTGTLPPPHVAHSAVYDRSNNRMIVFGGDNNFTPGFNDVWVLADANGLGGTPTWTQLAPSGTPPSARTGQSAVYDQALNRMTIFAGNDASGARNDTWVLSNANGLGGTPTWTQLAPSGTPPAVRTDHSAVYDQALNHMTIFAGGVASGTLGILNDTWVLSNANGVGGTPTWTQLFPSGTPPSARSFHSAVYDQAFNRMTMFGGETATGDGNDTWVLTNANGISGELEQCPPSGAGECDESEGGGDDNENDINGNGSVGHFSFFVRRPSTTQHISGGLLYVSPANGIQLQSVAVNSFVITGNTATFAGTCTNKGVPCVFAVSVTDSGPLGAGDLFTISISGGPTRGGLLRSGKIQIRKIM